jgi:hypothetical protein
MPTGPNRFEVRNLAVGFTPELPETAEVFSDEIDALIVMTWDE